MRQVQQIMGMPITIDIPKCGDKAFFERLFGIFRLIDKRFSTYKADSEISKFRRGEIKSEDLSDEMTAVMAACQKAYADTGGYFSAFYKGSFDPSGYVKALAIARAGQAAAKKYQTYCVSAGGDMLASSDGSKIWQIGLQDPQDRKKILNMLSISTGAVATSGNYLRGAHIINPKTGKPADRLLSVTVTGPDIMQADVLATAIFAKGNANLPTKQAGYQALLVDKQNKLSRRNLGNNR